MIVYVANAESRDIGVLRLDAKSGELAPIENVAVPGMVMPLAIAPDRAHLYAALRSEPYRVGSFAIDPATGRLRACGMAPLPHSMAYIVVDRSGRFLLAASYPGSLLSVSPIGVDGMAGPPQQIVPTAPNAHAIVIDSSNRFALAPILGGDVILQLRFDADSGTLSPNEPPEVRVRAGAGPRHLRFHPGGRFVYVLNELDASLDAYGFEPDRGTLRIFQTVTALPPDFRGTPSAADLHLTPDGRFLYASERGSSTLAAFAVDPTSGRLSSIASFATEEEPRGFAIAPNGRFLLAVGLRSHHMTVYAIDARSGAIDAIARRAMGREPNWVEIVDLP